MRQTLVLLSTLFAAGLSFASEPAVTTVEAQVWFSPAGGARNAILESIADAKKEILVGAYKLEDSRRRSAASPSPFSWTKRRAATRRA